MANMACYLLSICNRLQASFADLEQPCIWWLWHRLCGSAVIIDSRFLAHVHIKTEQGLGLSRSTHYHPWFSLSMIFTIIMILLINYVFHVGETHRLFQGQNGPGCGFCLHAPVAQIWSNIGCETGSVIWVDIPVVQQGSWGLKWHKTCLSWLRAEINRCYHFHKH